MKPEQIVESAGLVTPRRCGVRLMQRAVLTGGLLAACVVIGQSAAVAQETGAKHPLQPSDTSSPRTTLRSFVDACNELYGLAETAQTAEDFSVRILAAAERIHDCLDLSALPGELRDTVGVESGVYLKEVLDRIELPGYDEIPDATTVEAEPVSRWQIPGTRLAIARVQNGPQEGAYLFSPETVRQAAKFYSAAKDLPYRSEGPREIFQAFEEHGVQFSLPRRHSYWKRDDAQGPLEVKLLGDSLREDSDTSKRASPPPE